MTTLPYLYLLSTRVPKVKSPQRFTLVLSRSNMLERLIKFRTRPLLNDFKASWQDN